MSAREAEAEADAAARIIERLLVDPAFRADFRRDPATACRAAGLHELAEEMSLGGGKAMHTLEIRESRSSLAGVMMAAALEGMGVFALVEGVAPAVGSAPGAIQDVLSRVSLPALPESLRGSMAAPPAPAPGVGAVPEPGAAEDAAAGAPGAAAAPAAPTPAPAAAPAAAPAPAAEPEPLTEDPGLQDQTPAAPAGGAGAAGDDAPMERAAAAEPQDVDGAGAPPADGPRAPIDPQQFGRDGFGSGGEPDAEALALLDNKNIILDADGIADIKEGRIDPRVVAVLTKLSEEHEIQVSCMCRDHAVNTSGGSVSNHTYGRGMDIARIDGEIVNAGSPAAREVAAELGSLDPTIQPDEIGTPFQIGAPGYFTDAAHQDHIHVAFKQEIAKDWKPPADVAAGGSASAPAAADGAATAAAGAPAASSTLTMPVPERADTATPATSDTMSMRAVAPAQPAAAAPAADAAAPAAAGAAADAAAAAGGGEFSGEAGPKAVAALKEALKYKGTPYLWGGSTPETGFDCSGLVQWAYAQQGIQIPRVTDQQILATNGTEVKREDLIPGDLVFFRDPSGYVYHVGISMGGDKFLHAPRTGDVVKEASLKEPYFAERFTGGRRFDDAVPGDGAADAALAEPKAADVEAAQSALERDAAAANTAGTLTFKALTKQEKTFENSTVQFMRAVRPEDVESFKRATAADAALPDEGPVGPTDYPGDDATKEEIAAWMGRKAQEAGLPRELPVMAALVESSLTNIQGGDADSVGFFQMRVGIWDQGPYKNFQKDPDKQVKWFIDTALAVKEQRLARGEKAFLDDPQKWGLWIADVERPREDLRFKYQLRLEEARGLLRRAGRAS